MTQSYKLLCQWQLQTTTTGRGDRLRVVHWRSKKQMARAVLKPIVGHDICERMRHLLLEFCIYATLSAVQPLNQVYLLLQQQTLDLMVYNNMINRSLIASPMAYSKFYIALSHNFEKKALLYSLVKKLMYSLHTVSTIGG